jgi:hypothetical protein
MEVFMKTSYKVHFFAIFLLSLNLSRLLGMESMLQEVTKHPATAEAAKKFAAQLKNSPPRIESDKHTSGPLGALEYTKSAKLYETRQKLGNSDNKKYLYNLQQFAGALAMQSRCLAAYQALPSPDKKR